MLPALSCTGVSNSLGPWTGRLAKHLLSVVWPASGLEQKMLPAQRPYQQAGVTKSGDQGSPPEQSPYTNMMGDHTTTEGPNKVRDHTTTLPVHSMMQPALPHRCHCTHVTQ